MAQVTARSSLNLTTVDLIGPSASAAFRDNVAFDTGRGVTWSDVLDLTWATGIARFGGAGLVYDAAADAFTAGTITGYQFETRSGATSTLAFAIDGISISAATFYAAAKSAALDDDQAVLATVLAGADVFELSDEADVVDAFAGNDLVSAAGGSDRVFGGEGNDTLDGGTGDDTLDGGAGRDRLVGGRGNDAMYGGRGNDVYYVDANGDRVVETSADFGVDLVVARVSRSLGANLENLLLAGTGALRGFGNALDNVITGNVGANVLSGAAGRDRLVGLDGNDVLDGGLGIDTMLGGQGNDRYYVNSASDQVLESAGAGTDAVFSSVSRALGANQENLVLFGTGAIAGTGNTQDNVLIGNGAANELRGSSGNDRLSGGAGDDTLNGGLGNDTMNGGLGNDRYYVDVNTDVAVEDAAADGFDTVFASVSHVLGANLERLLLTGTSALSGAGNDQANVLVGNGAQNNLNGGGGNDTIAGLGGNDVLSGGTGDDRLEGGAGDDVYGVDSAGDVVVEAAGAGTDSINTSVSYTMSAEVENMRLTGLVAIDGTGNGLDNFILGNNAANTIAGAGGNDRLYGVLGDDVLSGGDGDDLLWGGSGADALTGGAGVDTFRIDRPAGTNDVDRLFDFVAGTDRISLDAAAYAGIGAAGALDAAVFVAGTAAADADDRIVYDAATGRLYFDADGNGVTAQILIASLDGNPAVTAADLFVL